MNRTLSTMILATSVGLSSGCSNNNGSSTNTPQLMFQGDVPTAVAYGSNRVNFALCSTDPGVLKITNDKLKNNGVLSLPEATQVCISHNSTKVQAVAMKTREGWYFSLGNTGDPNIDGSYRVP